MDTDKLISLRVNSEVQDWTTVYLTESLERLIEIECTTRKPRAFKVIRAAMANRLRSRIGSDVFDALYDPSVLEVE